MRWTLALAALSLVLVGGLSTPAQEQPPPRPGAPPAEGPPDAPEDRAPADEVAEDEAPAKPTRAQHQAALRRTVVHFSFRRAPVADIMEALERASGVPVQVGAKARKALKKRRFKMRYVADRTAEQVLQDVAKAAALDYLVSDDGVVLDTPRETKRLRKRLGLPGRELRLAPLDVTRALRTKQVGLSARDRPLDGVLRFLAKETGVRFVYLRPQGQPAPRISLSTGKRPLGELLDRLLSPHGLDWLQQGRVVLVDTHEAIAKQRAAAEELAKEPPGAKPGEPPADAEDPPGGSW